MKRSRVLSLNKSGFTNYLYKNRILLLLALFFALGIIFGVTLLQKSDVTSSISKVLFERYLSNRANPLFIHIFFKYLLSSVVLLFLIYISGTSFIGVVLSPFMMLGIGYFLGGFLGYVYHLHSIKGIAFNAIMIIPASIFLIIAFLLSAKDALNFSYELLKLTFNSGYCSGNIFELFKGYCRRYLLFLILPIVSAIIDALFSITVLKFFDF
ncbi:MAG: hypothetical protein E7561_01230 [Ruminococcaceae bacterium]|nr:hypothetical protein [Oscillospiraceae bacterium]